MGLGTAYNVVFSSWFPDGIPPSRSETTPYCMDSGKYQKHTKSDNTPHRTLSKHLSQINTSLNRPHPPASIPHSHGAITAPASPAHINCGAPPPETDIPGREYSPGIKRKLNRDGAVESVCIYPVSVGGGLIGKHSVRLCGRVPVVHVANCARDV